MFPHLIMVLGTTVFLPNSISVGSSILAGIMHVPSTQTETKLCSTFVATAHVYVLSAGDLG